MYNTAKVAKQLEEFLGGDVMDKLDSLSFHRYSNSVMAMGDYNAHLARSLKEITSSKGRINESTMFVEFECKFGDGVLLEIALT